MVIADIFEALTAKDRPYKKPMNLSQAIKILGFLKKDNHIDPDIHDLFLKSGIVSSYAKKEMAPEQIDELGDDMWFKINTQVSHPNFDFNPQPGTAG